MYQAGSRRPTDSKLQREKLETMQSSVKNDKYNNYLEVSWYLRTKDGHQRNGLVYTFIAAARANSYSAAMLWEVMLMVKGCQNLTLTTHLHQIFVFYDNLLPLSHNVVLNQTNLQFYFVNVLICIRVS
jgi:hypothetical protein